LSSAIFLLAINKKSLVRSNRFSDIKVWLAADVEADVADGLLGGEEVEL
jgi:hypothetical protein